MKSEVFLRLMNAPRDDSPDTHQNEFIKAHVDARVLSFDCFSTWTTS